MSYAVFWIICQDDKEGLSKMVQFWWYIVCVVCFVRFACSEWLVTCSDVRNPLGRFSHWRSRHPSFWSNVPKIWVSVSCLTCRANYNRLKRDRLLTTFKKSQGFYKTLHDWFTASSSKIRGSITVKILMNPKQTPKTGTNGKLNHVENSFILILRKSEKTDARDRWNQTRRIPNLKAFRWDPPPEFSGGVRKFIESSEDLIRFGTFWGFFRALFRRIAWI